MSTNLNSLFATESREETTNARSLSGTAQLTSTASHIADEIIKVMNADADGYAEMIKQSKVDNNAMDKLIAQVYGTIDPALIVFIGELDEATIDGMLKSQQSKRSRSKSKVMTLDNYKTLMTASVAECMIREASGKSKHSGGARRMAGSADYTAEQLEQLSVDQEKLRKEIRNVQSKKSIMKSKADFTESDERYQSLLKAEQQLKDLRVGSTPEIVEVDTTKVSLSELLGSTDLENLHAKDSKELLAKIAEMIR